MLYCGDQKSRVAAPLRRDHLPKRVFLRFSSLAFPPLVRADNLVEEMYVQENMAYKHLDFLHALAGDWKWKGCPDAPMVDSEQAWRDKRDRKNADGRHQKDPRCDSR